MAIRLSGLASGLDTEAIIKEMMSAQSMKKTKIQNKLTKLEWTQDIWKDLNKNVYGFYTTELSKFKAQSSYLTKSVTASDETKATFKAGATVPTGTHSVEISQIASAQFITGKEVKCWGKEEYEENGETITRDALVAMNNATKITEVAIGTDIENKTNKYIAAGTKLTLNMGKIENLAQTPPTNCKTATYTITENTTISDLTKWFKNNDINFSYDSTNGKFFISSMQSGTENSFTLTSSDEKRGDKEVVKELHKDILKYNTGLEYLDSTTNADNIDSLKDELRNYTTTLDNPAWDGMSDEQKAVYLAEKTLDITVKYAKYSTAHYTAKDEVYKKYIEKEFAKITEGTDGANKLELKWDPDNPTVWNIVKKDNKDDILVSTYRKKLTDAKSAYDFDKVMNDPEQKAKDGKTYKEIYNEAYKETIDAGTVSTDRMSKVASALTDGTSALSVLGIGEIKVDGTGENKKIVTSNEAKVIQSKDMKCTYNGADYTSASNSITINGLTINAIDVTTSPIKVTVLNDTQKVYDMIKSFVKKYNEILGELNEKYNAKTAKGYDVLTDEQKDKMSEKQIEKWEGKIKDSLLRRDNTVSSIIASLQAIAASTITINGKEYNLCTFGINTADYSERGLLHIDGDSEDSITSVNEDKLMKALANDPDTVMQVFTEIGNKLYAELQDKMASTKLSSALTFYNDKEMTSLKKDYEDQIKNWDKKLKEIEDRYYKKFSAMEAAMSKMNSQTNYISSMLGGQ